ncbi:MAG: hypothetical protein M1290_03130 [Candidatus Thermoplasmatota archaeon]|jgi:hypothetical protein|nr:hypothetical protein [Candidatus Thermoplasmatota archaeon]
MKLERMDNKTNNQGGERQERSYTLVEILLFLAEKPNGVRFREEIVGYENHVEYVKLDRLLSKKVIAKRDADKDGEPDTTHATHAGVGIVEKSISSLKNGGYIVNGKEMVKGLPKKTYKLRVNNIFDLCKLFDFIHNSDLKSSNALRRTQKFIDSPFFLESFTDHVLELIYLYCLWDELKYPIRAESYRMMMDPKNNIQSKLPLSSMNFGAFALPMMFPESFRPVPSREDYQNSPAFFRDHFPDEGPAKYENFLKENFFNVFLFMRLDKNLESVTYFFQFLNKYSEPVKVNSDIRINQLDHWFNEFWYGSLIGRFGNSSENRKYKKAMAKKVCLLDNERRMRGLHDFEEFVPLLIVNMLKDPESTNAYYAEHLRRRPEIKITDRYGVYPQKYPFKEKEFGKATTEITGEGKKFIEDEVRIISNSICLPVGFLEGIERSLGFHLDIIPLPSLDLYPGYLPEMPVSPPRLTITLYEEKFLR